ncbi:RagB/SusD family nutrient uptake outer membrane protein [Sphingobacterium litopenaei]|uniref:RagB/SusD family nutrient uptake outer membrane protein n=1 Tax=Sphingobacterium litopenaei TaxID=2763500 RepID=A0ABR7YC35_9SPHI|nr:RagB/SusD family nutrient uptake outer membrane protein [Sphingobacterium litopenaei]MBD1428877.1 RagB/SusD family nutrient uptake outer membrane protein [Sphingobacterium litopenaei]
MKFFKYTLLSTALLFGSCGKGFLEVEPIGQLGREQLFADPNGVRDALYGSYNLTAKFIQSEYGIYSDIRGEDVVRMVTPGSNYMLNEYNYSYNQEDQVGATFNIWADGYATLNNINNVLEGIEELRASSLNLLEKEQLNKYEGEARVLRALVFFALSNVYAQHYTYTADGSHLGIPIPTKTPAPGVKMPRATMKETYAQIISDLKSSITILSSVANEKIYASSDAAKALLSRIYLYMGDYANAENYATEVLSTGKYSLVPASEYQEMYRSSTQIVDFKTIKGEVLWQLNLTNLSTPYMASFYSSTNFLGTTNSAYFSLFENNDVRKSLIATTNSGNMTLKYYGSGSAGTVMPITFKVVRSAELYLNRAEAYYQQQKYDLAVQDLKVVRARAYNVSPEAITVTYTSPQDLFKQIKDERRKELGFEAHRIYDILRYKESVNRGENCNATACLITYPNDIFVMPIPKNELDANELIKPNPTVNN